ncbi:MAG: hypothetical protein H6712_08755 [Myxococcales bacterium]|nr:hypothetical protein [Myxococcales bacterium]MCB9713929.1 hypothetical protein [Myxococcales bacterium]
MLRLARRLRPVHVALLVALSLPGCGRKGKKGSRKPEGQVSDIEANRYIRRAIRQSSEGVILLPSERANRFYELPRLNEIAQTLRSPAASCFLTRAIETMEPRSDGEPGYQHVPEGQLKARVRIAPSGEVLRAEVLESGFGDEPMEACLTKVLEEQRWPPNKSGNTHYIDVVYWVSLGMQRGLDDPDFATQLRREEVGAGRRAKACLQGRVDAGHYEVRGLNLIDREGGTLVNRIDTGDLPEPIRLCIATALREIRLPRDPDAFVRPIAPRVAFDVQGDGTVSVQGERWLELLEIEERARLAAERRAREGEPEETDAGPLELVDELPAERPGSEVSTGVIAAGGSGRPGEESSPPPEPEPERPALDPASPGLRLDLGGRHDDDEQ